MNDYVENGLEMRGFFFTGDYMCNFCGILAQWNLIIVCTLPFK
jgi:hypothetical protein